MSSISPARRGSLRTLRRAGATVLALAAVGAPAASAAQSPPTLATAGAFGVLAGSAVTNTGPSVVDGDLGLSPGTSVSGFPPGTVNGTTHVTDATAGQAQADAKLAYDDLAGRSPAVAVTGDLGGLVLTAGVYRAASSIGLTGPVTLDAQGDPSAVFVFQIGSALTTASASAVKLVNGAQPCNVFWTIGSSATFGTASTFAGTVLAKTAVTMNDGVTLAGRVLARTGAVTMINDRISVPTCTAPGTPPAPTPAPGSGTAAAPGAPGTTTPGTATPGTATPGPSAGGVTTQGNGAAIVTTVPRSFATTITRFGTSRCLRGTFRTVVTGLHIGRVVFSVGPHVIARPTSGPFQAFVHPPTRGGSRTVLATVTFTDGTPVARVRLRYRACAAATVPVRTPSRPPRTPGGFTG